ncbi:hypothetical protein TrispH2_010625 [Trichoplax sp. H2]|nr:hypothetical protein TrispH2_010625 [Trichoplax sp. H2]|eukprot:RDD38006.1 hypothetical protein TrispH2_010625 [Trichoplax sp. H2]
MARNKEKQFSKLNRFLLAKQIEDDEAQGERLISKQRPPLRTLKTAEDVKKWIPSIKRELDYYLQQISGVRNYPEVKIKEFREKVDNLEIEHKRFIKKVYQLEPQTIDEPWKPRAYRSKKRLCEQPQGDQLQIKKVHLPLLEKEKQLSSARTNCEGEMISQHIPTNFQDQPLKLKSVPSPYLLATAARYSKSQVTNQPLPPAQNETEENCKVNNCLGLDYSSSDSDNEKV